MSKKFDLLTSVAVAALVASASSAFAADVVQNANNTGPVTSNTGGVLVGNISGVAGSATVSATGAAASVGVLGVNANFVSPGTFGNVSQSAINNAGSNVTIVGTAGNPGASITVNGNLSGNGSSASIGATGAASSISVAGINFGGLSTQSFGDIKQTSVNQSGVTNGGWPGTRNSISVNGITGHGAAASITAMGSASSVGASVVNSTGNLSFASGGTITQTTTHAGNAWNSVKVEGRLDDLTGVSGNGASASISATGAASAVSASYVNSSGRVTIGDVKQSTTNEAPGGTLNNVSLINGNFSLSGMGSSASLTSTGAISSVSLSGINSNPTGSQSVGNITQSTSTSGNVTNSGRINGVSGLSGHGSSAGVSATGAASAASVSQIGAGGTLVTSIGDIRQTTSTGAANVTNSGRIAGLGNGLTGDGSSASISATGAASSVAVSLVDSSPRSSTTIGDIKQVTTKSSGAVTNTGWVDASSPPPLSGQAASISVSAIGAGSMIGVSFINSTEFNLVSIGTVDQRTTNNANVTNSNKELWGPSDPTIQTGNISGNAASVGVSATGAASSVSVSSVNNKQVAGTPTVVVGPITQRSISNGSITNNGGSIVTGVISGKAASVGINATGAISSVNVASINDAQALGATNVGKITQTAINTGPIANVGSITTGGLSGNGASVSIAAAGAVSAVSFSAIK